ncbi:PREDICTED: uncharacterized protein LOC109585118 [Amphimedon queenslandica]|nr:PREDICTED: uncharacterized protein LOC109585118 [Amphimedon queenslandica]|eukprot:XP_019856627.1 PREDICTED: uncharacterized protein LOC109585118 [Amphimedon queenslandica]
MVDKEAAKELEKKASIDSTDGRGSDRVQLRKTEPPPTKPRSGTTNTSTDFGVKLKSRTQSDVTSVPPTDTKSKSLATPTNRTGGGGGPKTLADFQKLTSRGKQSPSGQPTQSNAPKDKRALIRMYVNASLEVRPPVSSDQELYQLCTKPSNLCKLINKSVRHTVDLRALTKTPPPTASTAEKTEAIEENMLLVVESARAIGCSVTDNMVEELTRGDKATIDKLIIELIKSRVVHMPGMEDEPSSTFNDLSTLMSKLGLAYTDSEETNGGTGTDSSNGGGGGGVSRSWRDEAVNVSRYKDGGLMVRTDDEHTPHSVTGSWREDKKTPEIDLSKPSLDANLSYEERAAIRRAERERRKKEREALAVPK